MSVGAVCKTTINDRAVLMDALTEILGSDSVEFVEAGVEVRGYHSGKKPTVLIKMQGLYGTAGYALNSDGNYELVYDSMDRRKLDKILPKQKNGVTHDPIAQYGARIKSLKGAKVLRGSVVKNTIDADGKMRIRIRTVQYG